MHHAARYRAPMRFLLACLIVLVSGSDVSRFFASRGDSSAAGTFYALFNGKTLTSSYGIGAATRTAGTWAEYGSNPVLEVGTSGAWDDAHVKDPCLLWDGTQYVMYYAGHDGTSYRIGRATASAHTGPWTKYLGNPVLDLGAGGAFDDVSVAFPTVYDEGVAGAKRYKMWYYANDSANETIGYAYSSDGISWTKVGQVIAQGSGGTWYDEGLLPGAIFKEAGTYYLFAGGQQDPTINKWQGGVWSFTDPEGVYTAAGGNPTMLARFNDANFSQTLDADPSPGATVVDIPTPSAFSVGEPVVIADGDTTAENFYLVTVGASTVTLDHAITGTFSGGGARFRSFASVSVVPRSVLARSGGGYEAFVSVFQPVEDLTQPASKLWEGSMEMRATTLTGAWTYYYVAGRGLLFPLSIGAAWHTRSAENPSVIAAP